MPNESTKKGNFVEIDFTAKIKQTGEIFDTTLKDEAKKAKLPTERVRPITVCIGEGMVLGGFDKALEDKEIGKNYSVSLSAKEAFGNRDPRMVKIIPITFFQSKGVRPYPGLSLNMDGVIVRVSAVSGGRVTVDFNHPLSGKEIIYDFKINKILKEDKEKLSSLVETFLREDPAKAIKNLEGKNALVKCSHKMPIEFLAEISKKMKELTGLTVTIESA